MLGTTCTTDEQTRMVAAFVECIVSSQRQTFNKQVHKYGYNSTLYLEGSKHLVRKKNKSGLGGNDFHIGGGKNSKRGVGGIMFESRREKYQPRAGACMTLGALGLYFVPSAMGSH